MTKEEYFGRWLSVLPIKEMQSALVKINSVKNSICPKYKDIFKAFHKCSYDNLKVIILGQDPYPQKGIATGIAFGNNSENSLSPSLQIIKESVINYEIPHSLVTFTPSLEEWEKQGILMLNTSLTCEINKPGSHSLIWRPFTDKLIKNICKQNTGIIFLLLGASAQSFEYCINKNQYIIKEKHPSYFYRYNLKMPYTIWQNINNILTGIYGYNINFYKEEQYG